MFYFFRLSQNQIITFPILNRINQIFTPISTYGNISKIKANSEYIARLSTSGRLDIWSISDHSLKATLKSDKGVFLTENVIEILDFCFLVDDNYKIGILFNKAFYIYSILNYSIDFMFKNPNKVTENIQWRQVYITKNHLSFLADNGNLQRYDRFTTKLKNKFALGFTFNKHKGSFCQNNLNEELYSFYSPYNRIRSFKCFINTVGSCNLAYQTIQYSSFEKKQVNDILSNKDCSLLYNEADNYRKPQIYNIETKKTQIYPLLGIINSISKFDNSNKYTMFILKNGSIFIFKNSTIISYKQNLGFNLSNVIKLDIFQSYILLGLVSEIKILKFQCGKLKYMFDTNLCIFCDQLCTNCSNINGQCYQCINQNYALLNGKCQSRGVQPAPFENITRNQTQIDLNQTVVSPNQQIQNSSSIQSQSFYLENSQLITNVINLFLKLNGAVSTLMMILTTNPFGFYFMSFINFWGVISLYALLQIGLPFYMKKILNNIYNAMNKSVFSIFGDDFEINNILFGQDFSQGICQKFNPIYNIFYGLSSKFLSFNIQQLLIILLCLFILFIMYILQKYIVNKKQWLYQKLKINYLYLIFQQFSTGLGLFCIGFILIINSQQSQFTQKINIILTLFMICFALCIPFFQLCSFKYSKKQVIKHRYINPKSKYFKNSFKSLKLLKIKSQVQSNKIDNKIREKGQNTQSFQITYAKKIQLIYLMQCNIILPITVIISISYKSFYIYFFIINILLYFFGLYSAFIRNQYRTNYIILNSYFIIFHFNCFLIWLINQKMSFEFLDKAQRQYLIYFFSLISLISLMLGAIHEIFFFIFEIINNVYQIVKRYLQKNKKVLDCTQEITHKQIKEKQNQFRVKDISILKNNEKIKYIQSLKTVKSFKKIKIINKCTISQFKEYNLKIINKNLEKQSQIIRKTRSINKLFRNISSKTKIIVKKII